MPPNNHRAASTFAEGPGSSGGSDRGKERTAAMYSLITTANLNDVDQRAWLADVIARITDHFVKRLDELLPWNLREARIVIAA
jgi:hypothetical protein